MKHLRLLLLLFPLVLLSVGCKESDSGTTSPGGCGSHNGKTLHLGPQGGCYYLNDSGNKVYVDRSECNC